MMKKQIKRTVYEAPVTERFSVELEGSLMAASIVDEDNRSTVVSSGHETGAEFNVSENFTVTTSGENAGFISGWE